MQILALSGSLRANSYNTSIIKALQKLNSNIEVYEELGTVPLFNPDLDIHTLEEDNSPKEVVKFRAKVREADVFIISTPEYAHQISGVLKNALDWLVSSDAIVAKSTVVISASTSAMGGDKAHAQLVSLLRVISQNVLEDASLVVSKVNKKIDEDGVVTDKNLMNELKNLLDKLTKTM
jgi:NAD(P)H-dependent FMN reductase